MTCGSLVWSPECVKSHLPGCPPGHRVQAVPPQVSSPATWLPGTVSVICRAEDPGGQCSTGEGGSALEGQLDTLTHSVPPSRACAVAPLTPPHIKTLLIWIPASVVSLTRSLIQQIFSSICRVPSRAASSMSGTHVIPAHGCCDGGDSPWDKQR